MKVPPTLIRRKKTHFHNIISGIQIILSNNGYIWIAPQSLEDVETGGYAENLQVFSFHIIYFEICVIFLCFFLSNIVLIDNSDSPVHEESYLLV